MTTEFAGAAAACTLAATSQTFSIRQTALRIAGSLLVVLSASCGGGGGGGGSGSSASPPPPPVAASITGYVDEGPVNGATVKLYKVDAAGAKTLLGSATTDSRGFYSITNSAPANAGVLIEANGGTYTDELTNQTLTLSIPLRAATTSNGGAATISVTPYSETAVRILERAAKPDWSGASIASANAKVATNIGTTQFLDFIPVNLMVTPPATGVRDNDLGLSFITSGFSGFAQRIDANPATSLASGLDGLYKLFAVDDHDDKLLPAFLGGITDFVDRSAASDTAKRQLKTLLLLGQVTSTPITDAELNRYKPTGTSSGGASAPMPDDAFHVLGVQAAGSMFNARGALIAYPLDDGSNKWRTLFTASVAEVYGDGDIGIGRWNGGATIDSTRAGAELTNAASAQLIPYGSFHYAVARPASNVPACGMRRLALVAATLPTLASEAVGAQVQALGLTADSTVSFQYGSDTLAGFDIGVRAADGSVTRYTSVGGADTPSSSTIHLSSMQSSPAALQPAPGTSLSGIGMDVQGLASGTGGAKLVLKLVIGRNLANRTELVAAFAAANPTVDASGCAVSMAGAPLALARTGP